MQTLRYVHILQSIYGQPVAILPEKAVVIVRFLTLKAMGRDVPDAEVQEVVAATDRPRQRSSGAIGVIPVYGTIAKRMDMMMESSGGTSTDRVAADLRAMLADPQVGSIILDIDSPGGSVSGVAELADEIRAAREQKPIVAVANTFAASAAYWIASAASEIVVAPSGQVGSIGVFTIHEDISKMLEAEGVNPTIISAGKFKTEGNPFAPLDPEAEKAIQEQVDAYYAMFIGAVAKGRGVSIADVRGGFGQGRMVMARDAVKLGMADRVDTIEGTIMRLAKGGGRPAGARAESFTVDASTLSDEALASIRADWEAAYTGPAEPESVGIIEEEPAPAADDLDLRARRLRLAGR